MEEARWGRLLGLSFRRLKNKKKQQKKREKKEVLALSELQVRRRA
jgi:hypothetical protein